MAIFCIKFLEAKFLGLKKQRKKKLTARARFRASVQLRQVFHPLDVAKLPGGRENIQIHQFSGEKSLGWVQKPCENPSTVSCGFFQTISIYIYMLDLTPIQDSTVTTRMTFHPFSGSGNPNLNIHDCDWHFVVAGVDPTYMTFSERFP